MWQQLAHPVNQFFQGESRGSRAGREFPRHLAQLTLTFDGLFLGLFIADEGSGSLMRFEQTPKFQFAIGAHDGIGVDREIHRHLADGRKLIAGSQRSRGNPGSNLVHELTVHGDAGVQIERELESAVLGKLPHVHQCTIELVHYVKSYLRKEIRDLAG